MGLRRLLVVVLFLALLIGVALAVRAEKSYVIEHYDVHLELQEDGAYAVRETLEFDFRGEPFTFAYREIRMGGIDRLAGLSVQSADVEILKVDENSGSRHSLRWEFPPRLGSTRFVLEYQAFGALLETEGRNRIDWDAVGRSWNVPIEQLTVSVVLPEAFGLSGSDVTFEPPDEATLRAATREGSATGWEVQFRYWDLPPETAYRVIVDFPRRLAGRTPPAGSPPPGHILGSALALLAGLLPGLATLIRRARGSSLAPGGGSDPEVPLHEAAALLHPLSAVAERGLVATVFDLARRGHVELVRRKEGGSWYHGTKTYLEATPGGGEGPLSRFEQTLLGRLRQRESLQEFGRKDRAFRRRQVAAVRKELIARGWLEQRSSQALRSLLLGLLGVALGMVTIVLLGGAVGWALGGLMAGLAGGWLMVSVRFLPATPEGARRRTAIKAWIERLHDEVKGHLELGDESRAAERWLDYLPWLTLKPQPGLLSKMVRELKKSEAELELPGWARDETKRRRTRAAAAFIAFEPYLVACRSTAGAVAPGSGSSSSGGAGAGAGGGAGGGGGGAG